MKKLFLLVALFSCAFTFSQYNQNAPWMEELIQKNSSGVSRTTYQPLTIYEISDSFEAYWKNKDPNIKGSGYKPFMRWKSYWEQIAHSDGRLPTASEFWQSVQNKRDAIGRAVNPTSQWTSIGPFSHGSFSGALPGQGRVNAVAVDPNNSNIWYVGAPAGGIWKSTNAGSTWVNLFDNFPQIGVSGIAIDPNNSNTIYISTGDDDAADSYSIGVFKSTNGGATWNTTGLSPSQNDFGFLMNEITIDPSNSNIIWVGTSAGLQKSEDAGATWQIKQNGNITDFKLKPGDSQTIYAVDRDGFYVSRDGGENFTQTFSNLPLESGRLALGVSAADATVVYVISAARGSANFTYQGLFKSSDSGETFVETANDVNIFESNQAWFDLAIEVNPTNADELYIGCLNIWKSSDGGDNFNQLNQWFNASSSYTHADIHTLKFFNGTLFCGSDGGIYTSNDDGLTFNDFTAGIAISQFYRLSVSKNNSDKMAGGLQDNSGFVRNNQNWNIFTGGDGMDYEIDPTNSNLVYGFSQFGGNLFISTDSGQSVGVLGPPRESNGDAIQGNWITPLAISSQGDVYAGFDGVYRLAGNAWEKLADVGTSNVDDLEIDSNDPMLVYAAVNNVMHRSINGGTDFQELHSFDSDISDFSINDNILYVTTSNRVGIPQQSQQSLRGVFKLTMDNGTVNVEEITANLPTNQAFLSIIHQGRNTTNPVFVGTNLGVYRIDDTLTEWEDYFTGFPNTSVSDLEISLDDGLITASTYGRGIWQSPIPVQTPDNDIRALNITPTENTVLCGGELPQIQVENKGANTITTINVTYSINEGASQNFDWTGTLASGATTAVSFPSFDPGNAKVISLSSTVTITEDAFEDNNYVTTNYILNEPGDADDIFTFENDTSENLISFNEGGGEALWERGMPSGTLLNTASSGTQVYGTVLNGNHPDNTKAFLLSKCYDLSTILAPTLKFNMAYDLEVNFDIVYAEYSIDNGENWNLLGNVNSQPNWYNSDRTNLSSGSANDCQNCPGGQWVGTNSTMTEYSYDFLQNAVNGETDLTSESNVMFRIVFQSDPSVNEEGAIVDDFQITGLEDDDDDDDDGVLDNVDNCPLISNADQADNDNDGMGDICDSDDDNDGIFDQDDNCPSIANPNQEDFDGDGIGDACDDDDDDDGLADASDTCPQTPIGAAIDVDGCEVFSLPANNFMILTKGESCIASDNGTIEIEAVKALSYTVTLTGSGEPISMPFTNTTSFNDLVAGDYKVCFTIAEASSYESCFDVTITQPEALSVSSKVSTLKSEITLDLIGGSKYFVKLNGEVFITSENQITLPLNAVENKLSVQTDKSCQGEYSQTIFLSTEVIIYPNPMEGGDVYILLGNSSKREVELSLYSTKGTSVIPKKSFSVIDNRVKLNVDALPTGVYILNVKADDMLLTKKIVRK